MGVYGKQGAWWIDWYEGRRRRREKTHVRTKREPKKILEQVKAKILPSELGLFDPKLSRPELVNRYLEALKGTRATGRRSSCRRDRQFLSRPADHGGFSGLSRFGLDPAPA